MNNSEWRQRIILMPRSCENCQFMDFDDGFCCLYNKYVNRNLNEKMSKPEWCTASKVIVEEKRNG